MRAACRPSRGGHSFPNLCPANGPMRPGLGNDGFQCGNTSNSRRARAFAMETAFHIRRRAASRLKQPVESARKSRSRPNSSGLRLFKAAVASQIALHWHRRGGRGPMGDSMSRCSKSRPFLKRNAVAAGNKIATGIKVGRDVSYPGLILTPFTRHGGEPADAALPGGYLRHGFGQWFGIATGNFDEPRRNA